MKNKERVGKTKYFLYFFVLLSGLFFGSSVSAATSIFRSVGVGSTSPLNTGGETVSISGSTAILSGTMPTNVGVGDVLVYNPGSGTTLAFISGRTSGTTFTVQAADGAAPETAESGTAVSVYRAYNSLSDAESGTENSSIGVDFDTWTGGKDLMSADQQWNIACYGDAEDTTLGVVINGWTTDNDNYIKIFTPYLASQVGISQRHSGAWDDGKYKLVVSAEFPDGPPIAINTGSDTSSVNVWIDGLQVFTNSSIMNSFGIEAYNVTGETKISNSIIKTDPLVTSNSGVYIHNLTHHGTYKLWNNIIYGFSDGGILLEDSDNTLYAYNNTVFGNAGYDVCYKQSSGTFIAKNNIAQNCFDSYDGTFDVSSTNNLTSGTDPQMPTTNAKEDATVVFVDSGNGNYKLDSTDTAATNQGTSLASDTYIPFSSDIESQARGASWDIGADEYASSDSTPPTLAQVTSVTTPDNDTTPDYTFSSTEVGNITYGGDCSSVTAQAISGNNIVTFSALSAGTHSNCTIRVTDAAGNTSSALSVSSFTIDITSPAISITSPVSGATTTGNTTIVFTNNDPNSPQCSPDGSSWIACISGVTKISDLTGWSSVAEGYFTLEARDTDAAGNTGTDNVSLIKDTVAPILSEITVVPTPASDTTPDYTFNSTESGTISYGGSCSSGDTSASTGDNTITFNALSEGTYADCTIQVTDAIGHASSALSVTSFTISSGTSAPAIADSSDDEEEDTTRDLNVRSVKFLSGPSAIQVTWKTNYNSSSKVKFGIDRSIKKYKKKTKRTKAHKMLIKNLIPNTVYYLRVQSSDEYGNEGKSKVYAIRTKK